MIIVVLFTFLCLQVNVFSSAAWLACNPNQALWLIIVKGKKDNNITFPKGHSNISHIEQMLPDPWKRNSHIKLMQAVTLITNRSNCWICSQFPTHSDESIWMMGIPMPNIFSNGVPPVRIMRPLEKKTTQTSIDQQILTIDVIAIETSCVHRCLEGPGQTSHQKIKLPECNQGIMAGVYPKCHTYLDATGKSSLNTYW